MNVQDVLSRDYDVVSGAVGFKGTRVPIEKLFIYLAAGSPLDDFLCNYPTVERTQAKSTLALAADLLIADFL